MKKKEILLSPLVKILNDNKITADIPNLTRTTVYNTLLLTHHPVFVKFIGEYRDKNKIKSKYPLKPNYQKLLQLFYDLEFKEQNIIEEQAKFLVSKFRLTKNWLHPIKIKILTDVFPIPYDISCAELHKPIVNTKKLERKNLFDVVDESISDEFSSMQRYFF